MKLTAEQELLQQQAQEEAQRQAAVQSQTATQVDTGGIADTLLEIADMGLDLMSSAGGAVIDGGCAVASCAGDLAVGTVEVAGSIIGGTFEVIGGILGALAD